MSDFFLFLGKFLRHGTRIASIAPSSPWLAQATLKDVDWQRARVIIELGAGTGPITRAIAEQARPETRVIVLECDPDFVRLLRQRFTHLPGFEVVAGDARDLAAILEHRGIRQVDAVISGLPVPSFASDRQIDLFRVVRAVLAPEGIFNQITEIPWLYQRLYRRFFEDVRFTFEPRNFPPAGAYQCRGIKEISPT